MQRKFYESAAAIVKKILLLYYFLYYASIFAVLLFGLTFVLASCVPDDYYKRVDQTKGPNVNIAFSIDMSSYTEGGNITRSSSDSPKPVTTVVPLDEGLFLEATLIPEPKAPKTRAGEIWLIDSTKVCIAAYDDTDAYVKHQLYTVDGDSLRRSQPVFELPAGAYKFVAYAYHNYTTRPASKTDFDSRTPPGVLSNIEPATDLLYGTRMKTISTDSSYVEIPVIHLFSRIDTIKAIPNPDTGTPNLTAIADVSVKTRKAHLSLQSAPPLSPGDTLTYTTRNSRWSAAGTGGWECSDTLLAYPGKNTIVELGTVTVAAGGGSPAKTYHNVSTTFIHELAPSYSYTLQVTLTKWPTIPVDNQPLNAPTYVGAFWRHDETGERIIRIAGTGATPTSWTATVAWWDNRWHPETKDGIVLAPGESPNLAGTAESNQVLGSTTLNGTASASQPILFRIGLQKPFTAGYEPLTPDYTSTFPARYAVVLIYYNGLVQKLFLRQGEGPDYLMNRGDSDEGGNSVGGENRGFAARFSPYNLTATNLNTVVRATYAVTPNLSEQESKFTEYPTQAGAFFQWANGTGTIPGSTARFDWQAFGSISGWDATYPNGSNAYWLGANTDTLYRTHETCPDKYRRPFDGAVNGPNTAGAVAGSEIRESLWYNPQSGTTNDVKNSAWGYYADGFFDRRQTGTNPDVAANSPDIAYIGRLFYNPDPSSNHYNASLFFPAAGYRSNTGTLANAGSRGTYLTASSYSINAIWFADFQNIPASLSYNPANGRAYGHSIRCVYEPEIQGVTLFRDDAGAVPVGSRASLRAEVMPLEAGNTHYEWQILVGSRWEVITETFSKPYKAPVLFIGAGANIYRVRVYNGAGEAFSNAIAVDGVFPIDEPLPNVPMYMGAFWRANQRGERIVRISVGDASLGNSGPWEASVSLLSGPRWAGDSIVLSKSFPHRNILWTNSPGDAENYPVQTDSTYISGTVAANGYIEFRIGITNSYSATSSDPARYALVLISYGEGKFRRIFIRQGHDPDYMMRPGTLDPGTGIASRPNAVKFSPYNIKDQQNRIPSGQNNRYFSQNSGVLSPYPSMSGYMFAFSVFFGSPAAQGLLVSPWSPGQTGISFWTTSLETCPNNVALSYGGNANYRRPNDGGINGSNVGVISLSEIRQSLWLNPPANIGATNTSGNNSDNSVGGFYADGYFDRGLLVSNSTAGQNVVYYNHGFYGAGVSPNYPPTNNDNRVFLATAGRLFYNPNTYASLFFPATGEFVGNQQGIMQNVGALGGYWTSSAYANGNSGTASYFSFNSDSNANSSQVYMTDGAGGLAQAVRCVTP